MTSVKWLFLDGSQRMLGGECKMRVGVLYLVCDGVENGECLVLLLVVGVVDHRASVETGGHVSVWEALAEGSLDALDVGVVRLKFNVLLKHNSYYIIEPWAYIIQPNPRYITISDGI